MKQFVNNVGKVIVETKIKVDYEHCKVNLYELFSKSGREI